MAIGAAMMKMTGKARFLALPQRKIRNLHHTTQSHAAKHRQVIHERFVFSLSILASDRQILQASEQTRGRHTKQTRTGLERTRPWRLQLLVCSLMTTTGSLALIL
jgi:hypothetical protein